MEHKHKTSIKRNEISQHPSKTKRNRVDDEMLLTTARPRVLKEKVVEQQFY